MISSSSMTRIEPCCDAMVPCCHCAAAAREPFGRRRRERSVNRVPWPSCCRSRIDAFVLTDDAVGDRQAEARALADGLGREERIVDTREILARNARAGVGHLDNRLPVVHRASRWTASRRSASRPSHSGTGSGTPAAACARCRARAPAAAHSSRRTLTRAARTGARAATARRRRPR